MTGATFGRKGMSGAEPVRHRAETLVTVQPAADEMARRRAAFIAAERARAEQAVDDPSEPPMPAAAVPTRGRVLGEKSLATAYLLWLFLGGLGAHRFYLGRPLGAVIQTALWYVGLMFFMAGHPGAFYILFCGWIWILGDGLLIPGLHRQANERIRARSAPIG